MPILQSLSLVHQSFNWILLITFYFRGGKRQVPDTAQDWHGACSRDLAWSVARSAGSSAGQLSSEAGAPRHPGLGGRLSAKIQVQCDFCVWLISLTLSSCPFLTVYLSLLLSLSIYLYIWFLCLSVSLSLFPCWRHICPGALRTSLRRAALFNPSPASSLRSQTSLSPKISPG